MKLVYRTAIMAAALAAHSGLHAQSSLLRVTCEGEDIGAEVTVNGQLKGTCPLDIEISAGAVKLRAVKKTDAARESVFEEDFSVSAGATKRIEVVLSQPRQTDLSEGRVPPRPRIPIGVSNEVWKTIEASETYRNLPQQRAIKVTSQSSTVIVLTGSKFKTMPTPAVTKDVTTLEIVPLGDRCVMHKYTKSSDGVSNPLPSSYYCGPIRLGDVRKGKTRELLTRLDEMKGSAFPMRIGATWSIRMLVADLSDRSEDMEINTSCEVVSQGPAREVDPRLEGTAWKLQCLRNHKNPGRKAVADGIVDYYLEDLGAKLSDIGQYDDLTKKYVLPSPGSQIVNIYSGEFGAHFTVTYTRYDWTLAK